MTLNDRNAPLHRLWLSYAARCVQVNEDRPTPTLSAGKRQPQVRVWQTHTRTVGGKKTAPGPCMKDRPTLTLSAGPQVYTLLWIGAILW